MTIPTINAAAATGPITFDDVLDAVPEHATVKRGPLTWRAVWTTPAGIWSLGYANQIIGIEVTFTGPGVATVMRNQPAGLVLETIGRHGALVDDGRQARRQVERLTEELEQTKFQLGIVQMAATADTYTPLSPTAYGWSPALEAVCELRAELGRHRAANLTGLPPDESAEAIAEQLAQANQDGAAEPVAVDEPTPAKPADPAEWWAEDDAPAKAPPVDEPPTAAQADNGKPCGHCGSTGLHADDCPLLTGNF